MINRRELILGTAALPILSVPVEAFQLPEDRLISKAKIVLREHASDDWAAKKIRDSLMVVYQSEQKYWSRLSVYFAPGEKFTDDAGFDIYLVIVRVVYQAHGVETTKTLRIDTVKNRVITDEEWRDMHGFNRSSW